MADHAGRMLHARRLPVGSHELPGTAVELPGVVEGGVLRELRRFRGRTGATQIRGARHQQLLHAPETAHHQAILARGHGAHAQRHVKPFAHHIHAPVAHVQLQAHRGVLRQELGQDQRQSGLGERDRAAGLDGAARRGARELHRFQRCVRFGEHRGGMPIHLLADLGHHEPPRGAVHQAHAECPLERHHVT